jgi:hypothetical protein
MLVESLCRPLTANDPHDLSAASVRLPFLNSVLKDVRERLSLENVIVLELISRQVRAQAAASGSRPWRINAIGPTYKQLLDA